MDNQKERNDDERSDFTTILVLLIILIVTCIVFLLYQKNKSSKRGVLLTGLCDSGKTLLFSQIVHSKPVTTVTSMKVNVGEFPTNNGVLRIIDIPGHERLRGNFLEQYISSACGIMYIIDSITVQKELKDVAEFLYNILVNSMSYKCSSVIVLCNKQDLPLAKTSTAVKSLLEKELNTLRVTKASQLESVDPKASGKIVYLGSKDKEFTFSSLPLKVEFLEVSAADNMDKVNVHKWLQGLC